MLRLRRPDLRPVYWGLLAPFVFLSLVASVLMPARAVDGTGSFVLCSGDGPMRMAIDPVTGKLTRMSGDGPIGTPRDGCAWACAQAQVMIPAPMSAAVPAPVLAPTQAAPPPALLLAEAGITGLPPATGPPAAL
ncbi:MAG: hypothetical protein ACK40I_12760 [Tabrizicola sp.]